MIADQAGNTVWRWDNQEPFGSDLPNDDPGNTGTPFVFNLRFPGQYFDRETGLNYNYFRNYDPVIGRYVEADPVGSVLFRNMAFNNLGGLGLSHPELASLLYRPIPQHNQLYTYGRSSPVIRTDPMGLLVPPSGTPSDRECIKVAEYLVARTWTGPIFGWPPTVLIQCVYFCPPKGMCPPDPDGYYYSMFVEGPELIPGVPRCPMFGRVSDLFP